MKHTPDAYQDIRDAVRELCRDYPDTYWREVDKVERYPHEFIDALTKSGYLAALIPEEFGGAGLGITDAPLEFLLFSDFAVVLCYVNLFTLFMIVPIFNSMMRIDRSLLEAARDGGANGWQTLWNVILPLCKPGIAIGSIFVVTIVMGDFVTVRLMSGGQTASVGLMMMNAMSLLQYPAAAANAVILLLLVLITVAAMMRLVDIRKEL